MKERRKYAYDIEKSRKRAEVILARVGFEWEGLRNKSILDIGAGRGDFARVAKTHDVHVVSVDYYPFLADGVLLAEKNDVWVNDPNLPENAIEPYIQLASERIRKPMNFLRSDAALLPFADNSFDIVFTHAGPPACWSEEEYQAEMVVSEMMRVLKPGGECRISPAFALDPYRHEPLAMDKSIRLFEKYACNVDQIRLQNKADTQYFRLRK